MWGFFLCSIQINDDAAKGYPRPTHKPRCRSMVLTPTHHPHRRSWASPPRPAIPAASTRLTIDRSPPNQKPDLLNLLSLFR